MEFNFKKWVQIINLLSILEWKSIDKLKVLKLIWLADRVHLRKYWKLIAWDIYLAMPLWPVASWMKNIFDQNEEYLPKQAKKYIQEYLHKYTHKVKSIKKVDYSLFSETNIEIIKEIYIKFWTKSWRELINITHNYPEWTKFEEKINNWIISQAQMNYFDFFKNIPSQDSIFNISKDNLELSKDIFEESRQFSYLFA